MGRTVRLAAVACSGRIGDEKQPAAAAKGVQSSSLAWLLSQERDDRGAGGDGDPVLGRGDVQAARSQS